MQGENEEMIIRFILGPTGSGRRWVLAGSGWAFNSSSNVTENWIPSDWIPSQHSSSSVVFFFFFSAGALCTWTTRYQLACLAHTGSLQSLWRNSVLLLALWQGSTQHASHMNNHILSLHSNTLELCTLSPFHFLVLCALRLSIIQQATRWRRMIELVFSLWLDDSQSN